MGVGSPILYLENRILKDIYSKKERHKRGNFFMSAEKIETSEAVYRDIYGKTKKKEKPKTRGGTLSACSVREAGESTDYAKQRSISSML